MRPIASCLGLLLLAPPGPAGEPAADRYGDPLPPGAVARFGTDRLRHAGIEGEDTSFAFRPDGKAVATWNDSTVRLWDLSDGKRLWEFDTRSSLLAAAFSPDGQHLAVCTGAGVRVVDVATGRPDRILIPATRTVLAVSPDGRTLAVSEPAWGGPVEVWDVTTGKRTAEFRISSTKPDPDPKPEALAFSADGKVLRAAAIGTRGGSAVVRVASWDLATGERLPDFDPAVRMHSYRMSDDGRLLGTRTAANTAIQLWDTTTGQPAGKIHVGDYGPFTFGPGGRTVVTAAHDRPRRATRVTVWDAGTQKKLHEFAIPRDLGEAARLSPDGKLVATPKRGEMLCLWDAETGRRRLASEGHSSQVTGLAFADGGAVLVSAATAGDVRAWDAAAGAHTAIVSPDLRPFALLPGGRELIAGTDGLRRFDLATGRPIGEPFAPPALAGLEPGHTFRAESLALSGDGRSVTARGRVHGPKGLVRYAVAWDLATGRPTAEHALAALPKVDSVTPDGRTAVAYEVISRPATPAEAKAGLPANQTTDLRAFDGVTGRLLMAVRVPDQFTYHSAVAPDGQTVATVSGKRGAVPAHPPATLDLRLWEVRTGKERAVIPLKAPGHYDPHTLAFSPDGRLMAVSRTAVRIEVIDLATGREMVARTGYELPSYKLAFRPDGRRLASGHTDGTILMWDVPAPPTPAATAEALEAAWKDLVSEDAGRAYAATWALASAPAAAVKLLAGRVKPADPAVIDRVRAKIAELDSKSFQVREAAAAELANLAGTADGVLREALGGKLSAEQGARLQRLLDGPAVVRSAEDLRALRATEVLERIGTPAAVGVLQKLAAGAAELRPTREARAALERLAERAVPGGSDRP